MGISSQEFQLGEILDKAYREIPLNKAEIIFLLGLNQEEEISQVFQVARDLRQRYFGEKLFLYGFVYFSTFCQNNCTFCLYRKSNRSLKRYRKSEREILDTAYSLAESGVHLLDLCMGEDPEYLMDSPRSFGKLLKIVEDVKQNTGLPLMISPGLVPQVFLERFQEVGVNWYALYQETHNRSLYAKMRLDQDYDARWGAKRAAHHMGLLVEEGLLTGIGDTMEDVADSFQAMKELGAEQVRVMSFVPQEETPMEKWVSPPRMREILIIAVMRLLFPDRLIPASLDVDGIRGLKQRLNAGANVVTSIIPPKAGLAGVSNNSLDIDEGNRTVKRVAEVVEDLGLRPASLDQYIDWVEKKQKRIGRIPAKEATI